MNDWQDLVAGCAIAAAAVYLARVLWVRLARRTGAGCNSCSGCSASLHQTEQQNDPSALTIQSTHPKATRE